MDVATAYYEPWDPLNPDDVEAVNTRIIFEYAFYYDPLVFGDYPQVMKDYITDNRLPTFTEDEKQLIKGSFDYLGLNHYYSKYVYHTGQPGRDYGDDARSWLSETNKYGHQIGPRAESSWLTVYPEGLRKLLNWLDKRYNHPKIYVFENGVSVPGENSKPIEDAVHDDFRTQYYTDYT